MNHIRKAILLRYPALFLLYYFPHAFQPTPESDPKLEAFHLRLIYAVVNEIRCLILYPAGHGKTTIACTLLPIYFLCQDFNVRIALIAKNEVDAKGVMRSIHAELLGNKRLIRDFGEFEDKEAKSKAWSIERIDIKQKTKERKEGSIQIYGSKGNVLGKRFDRVICDDVVTEKNSSTADQRQAMMEWFNMGVETMPEHPGVSKLAVVGTLFDPEDLYHVIKELRYPDTQEEIYVTRREDAVADEDLHTTLWPERWSWESLMAQKAKMGTLDFNKRYRNFAVDASRLVFKSEYLRGGYVGKERYEGCLDEGYVIGDYADNWRRIAGFDPALGHSKMAKFCAHFTLGVGSCIKHERCYWAIDLVRDQFSQQQQVDLIINQHEKYSLWKTVIEVNGYQLGLEEAVQQKIADHALGMIVEPHVTSRNNKPDPELGVSGMSPMVENGLLHIPWGDAHSRRVMEQLVGELEIYPSGKSGATSDTVMAMWFAWKAAQSAAPRYSSFNRLEKGPKPSMFANTGGRRVVRNPAYDR